MTLWHPPVEWITCSTRSPTTALPASTGKKANIVVSMQPVHGIISFHSDIRDKTVLPLCGITQGVRMAETCCRV